MKNALFNQPDGEENQLTLPAFGYHLIRHDLLMDMLGKDAPQLLYWAGKSLARRYPLESNEEIIDFFKHAGWGTLTIEASNKKEMELHLSGELITAYFKQHENVTFQLEAGFLAQQFQQQRNQLTEAYEQQKKRAFKVIFTVKWDS